MMHFLAFGSLWFWIFTAVFGGLIIRALEVKEFNFIANVWLIAFIAALWQFGNNDFFTRMFYEMLNHPSTIILFLGIYLVLGTIWSFVKWFFYLKKESRNDHNFEYHLKNNYYDASYNKERIIHWMLYWPLSGLWTLINDPIRTAFEYIVEYFGGTYNKITKYLFKDMFAKIEQDRIKELTKYEKN